MNFIVICKDDNGKYVQIKSAGFETRMAAEHYALGVAPSRDAIVVDLRPPLARVWSKEQIENFLRQETSMMDDACKRLASTLFNKGIINLMLTVSSDDYTVRAD